MVAIDPFDNRQVPVSADCVRALSILQREAFTFSQATQFLSDAQMVGVESIIRDLIRLRLVNLEAEEKLYALDPVNQIIFNYSCCDTLPTKFETPAAAFKSNLNPSIWYSSAQNLTESTIILLTIERSDAISFPHPEPLENPPL